MARIAGIDLPRNKQIDIGLTYIYGIGRKTSVEILEKAGVDPLKRDTELTESEVSAIREVVDTVFRLEIGAVGPVIETPTALYLVKVESIVPARKPSFAEVQDEIRKRLTDAELALRRRAFSRQLEQRAFIRVYYQ